MRAMWPTTCLLASSLVACQAYEPVESVGTDEAPLIGGNISTDDPAVVALTRGGSASFCTGTLVSPSVVLTAAHCIDMAGTDPNVVVYFGDDTTGDGIKIGVSAKFQHIGWTGNLANGNDIGLLLMAFPKTDVTPIPMNTAVPVAADPYRVVGFGIFDQQNQLADGKKRTGDTVIDLVRSPPNGDEIEIRDSQTIVCFGDSGGPGLVTIDDTEYVAGVHSWTSGDNCGPPNGDTRVDLFAASELQPWIDANDPTCKEDGICAKIGCTDDPDCTPCGPDGTCVTDCALPDPDCPTQDLGELCRADTQCMSGLCVFWSGDPGTKFCSRPCTTDDCPDGMSCQRVTPFGDICYYDEDPPGVLGDDCEAVTDCGSYQCVDNTCVTDCDLTVGRGCPPDFVCSTRNDADYLCWSVETDEGGGCCQAGGDAPGALLVLLVAGALSYRRRRRAAGC